MYESLNKWDFEIEKPRLLNFVLKESVTDQISNADLEFDSQADHIVAKILP